mmetsp:Transcript_31099/g.35421  ORF Transcript_31099/g.35421 Transcript_31099/m.35421 type:complete len:139 (+) Transcript_31099:43-459(+)
MTKVWAVFLAYACIRAVEAFNHLYHVDRAPFSPSFHMTKLDSEDDVPLSGFFKKAVKDFGDMFSNLDDAIDDFYNKRMGKGEIFYGKRKYKPSGTVEGKYNGFGLTDKQRIDETREMKEFYMELRKIRQEKFEEEGRG